MGVVVESKYPDHNLIRQKGKVQSCEFSRVSSVVCVLSADLLKGLVFQRTSTVLGVTSLSKAFRLVLSTTTISFFHDELKG
jgi:hypothetical protein